MADQVQNFNRIIDLTFFDDVGNAVYTIKCPRKGRKPNIQITGTLTPDCTLNNLEIKIKNLYLDLTNKQFTTVSVRAGYESNNVEFKADIYYMYRENPGPESVTNIKCLTGNVSDYLTGSINKNYPAGYMLTTVLTDINDILGFTGSPRFSDDVKAMSSKCKLLLNCDIKSAIEKIKTAFPNLLMRIDKNGMYCYSLDDGITFATHRIPFLSTPPQLINDGTDGADAATTTATLTAPWDPAIACGDIVECPVKFYRSKLAGTSMSDNSKTLKLQTVTIQFQFATVGGINSMVIMGTAK